MHEVGFIEFGRSIFKGLANAVKTDPDVFLITVSAILWPVKIFRGFSVGSLFYVGCRRADGLMMAYTNVQKNKISNVD